jgi:hypothetical protein
MAKRRPHRHSPREESLRCLSPARPAVVCDKINGPARAARETLCGFTSAFALARKRLGSLQAVGEDSMRKHILSAFVWSRRPAGRRVLIASVALTLSAVMAVSLSDVSFAAAYDPDEAPGIAAAAYDPDDETSKYIEEMVAAGLLAPDVYDRSFYDDITRADLATYAVTFYYFIGGGDYSPVGDNFIDTADPNAEKAYALGMFDYNEGYFNPEASVNKDEALAVLARAVIAARPGEGSYLPPADAALASLALKYSDAHSIGADALPYVGFMDARGALLPPRYAGDGDDIDLGAYATQSNEDFFLLLSDAAWAFAKRLIAPHAIAPGDPEASEGRAYLASAFKNNTYLYWQEASGAYSYNVKVYISKKLKAKLTTNYASLSLDKTSTPTYRSVFGNPQKKKPCYLKVRAADRHGVKSKRTLKINFVAERFVNINHKLFGNKNRFGFKSAKAAKKYQKMIEVKVWKLSGGKKRASKTWLLVNKEVADDVKRIFAEIYKGKEKFPIKAMGGFQIRSSKSSEHNYGTAIDINPTENCMKDGSKVVAGAFWKPGKNKYSIKPDGDVVKAFEKYGWYWGGHGWGDRKDYMHFSYLGT